ncbi:MAG: recombination protein O N-terminal domain-containing protein [Peptococcaceae bacterium]|nr:recombination protein O N-terminal domain-containing protein [Peptococcaceae bacterium]
MVQYKDNSYIAEIFTQRFGKVSFSVHRPQSKKGAIRNYHLMPSRLMQR